MAETVVVEKYKSLNGYVYDKLADAERADAEWREENEYDLEKDINTLTKLGERDMRYMRRNEEQRRYSQYPMLYVLESKHANEYYVAMNLEAVPRIYFEILKYNKEYGFYWSPAPKAITDEIVRTENHLAAMSFVKQRVDYQYENVHTESVTMYEA
jgi:hypothetical protein